MKKNLLIKILIGAVMLGLLCGVGYFYNEANKPDINIRIGTPKGEGIIEYSGIILDKDIVNYIQMGLIIANSVEKEEVKDIVSKLPSATITTDDTDEGVRYLEIECWIDKNDVIFKVQNEYRRTVGDWGEHIKGYINTEFE
ncbi:hypothetical protein [uncultured Clostridium sp.]|uniref:hypothetical protein n=1 Tax=uncultured Clostridium sp. TaxID=59620 RepID=UPI00260807FE|nr:hypothetical protein [uncultured Clostridium sp.]